MKRIHNLRRHHYLAKFGIFWIMVALIVVMVGCEAVAEYSLTMAVNPAGCGTATDLTGGSPYIERRVVSIEAVAAAGYRFVNWSAPAGGFLSLTDERTTFTMPGEDVTVTANFEPSEFYGGNGTEGDPYQIADWYQLDNVRNYLDSSFILVNNLDSTTTGYTELAGPTANGGKGWQPIGSWNASYDPVDPFTGTFDGQGYEIRDLFINRPDELGVGLFGAAMAVPINNVRVVNANVTGGHGAGILAGGSAATLNSCYSSGSVSGSDNVGGLVGGNVGSIVRSCSTASVRGHAVSLPFYEGVGGLVGENEGTISDCYARGSVAGVGKVGGLVGLNFAAGDIVERSYSTGSVTGSGEVGGLVGRNDGTVIDSFWDTVTSGRATSAGGTGKTTAEMKSIATFSGANWNIIEVANPYTRNRAYTWNIANGQTYPFLSWQTD